MIEIKKILFPVDLSESSPGVVPYVEAMAEKFGAAIHLLFVTRILQHFTSIYVPHPSVDRFEQEIAEGARKSLAEFREAHFSAFPDTQNVVIIGHIADEIVAYAESNDIDLIIMGTHGRRGIDKIVFGSVSDRVTKLSPVPVLVVNPYRKP